MDLLVIPTYEEAATIGSLLDRLQATPDLERFTSSWCTTTVRQDREEQAMPVRMLLPLVRQVALLDHPVLDVDGLVSVKVIEAARGGDVAGGPWTRRG